MRTLWITLAFLSCSAVLAAQQPSSPSAAPAAGAPQEAPALEPAVAKPGAPEPPGPPPPAENYAYLSDGRRDPFLSLIGTGSDPLMPSIRPDGVAGLLVNEVSVRGIVHSRGTLVAAVQGPDNKTYLLRQGDKLLDGTVKAVTEEGLTIVQAVNDPLSIVKQREVQKLLRSLEGAK